ncbi:MAG: O-acetyl-ADP-ribose deacetylase [Candidatus Eremiobacteraeota bacterium]|nr:O-acetyl-ADP-ribose deacetylase [Candidatus Eremiobacteraeota bacterium]MBC5827586.1 O-acetyl-ADP-ribose deacetylase [Candidatus Eremiobacteraeota bacterium]
MRDYRIAGASVHVLKADITTIHADAIVNAANGSLVGGGGVDGAIHRAGGPSIMEECRRIGRCATGDAVITAAGHLQARHVIHAVAPRYKGRPDDERLLASAYASSLRRAEEAGDESIAFPSLGTGAYGYPVEQAAAIAVRVIVQRLRQGSGLRRITFALFSDADLAVYERQLTRV